jgi:hypothetical protein
VNALLRLQEAGCTIPAGNGGKHCWKEDQNDENAYEPDHVLDTRLVTAMFLADCVCYERNSTDSRWNIFTARYRAPAA